MGVEGNEAADELARKGSETTFTGPEPFCGLGPHTIRRELKKEEDCKRIKLWEETPKLRQAKELLGNYNRKRSRVCMNINKNRLRILTGFLTGHCRLKEHLRKLGIEQRGECRFCGDVEETPGHLLKECGALIHERRKHLDAHQLSEEDLPLLDPLKILRFIKEIGLEEVL